MFQVFDIDSIVKSKERIYIIQRAQKDKQLI